MKPIHEQEWVAGVEPYGTGERVVVRTEEGRTVAHLPAYDPKSNAARKAHADLLSAAPGMARALLALVTNDDAGHVNRTEDIEAARTALRKAGVLP